MGANSFYPEFESWGRATAEQQQLLKEGNCHSAQQQQQLDGPAVNLHFFFQHHTRS